VIAANTLGEHHKLQRRLSQRTFTFVVMVALLLFALGYKAVARGLVLGASFSVLNFMLLAQALGRQLGHGRRRATVIAFASIGIRFAVLAIPLIVALRLEAFDFWWTVVGLFCIPAAILVDHGLAGRRLFWRG